MSDNIWKKLKEAEITQNHTSYMAQGDYFIYTGNVDKSGHYNGQKKYIFKLEGDMQFSKFGSDSKTWTVPENKQRFANVQWLVAEHGVGMLEEIALSSDFEEYMKIKKEKKMAVCTQPASTNNLLYSGIEPTTWVKQEADTSTEYIIGNNLNKEENKMSDKIKEVIEDNADAAKVAAQVVAGKTLNDAVMQKVVPQLPILVRGYASTPLGAVVLANVVNFGVQNFMQDNVKAEWVADAMMVAAMTDALSSFNLEKILKEVIDTAGVVIPEVTA